MQREQGDFFAGETEPFCEGSDALLVGQDIQEKTTPVYFSATGMVEAPVYLHEKLFAVQCANPTQKLEVAGPCIIMMDTS